MKRKTLGPPRGRNDRDGLRAAKAADIAGISLDEISEEVGSVFEVISEAMQHRDGGSPD
ncbi:DUF768 domain-containing protein [Mesorhizobium sp. B2-4-2]|nr:DUF768 domain-containing protein [Mesorhizobium sp. B2-4-4]TPL60305.1 DUF768 domain-containing protein [Mesorhizobium sp. B2-4-2]TPN55888.1 DUF768 domain-containing protein [Mesorhizobium sp. B1-1-4]